MNSGIQNDVELKKYMKRIADTNKMSNVIFRGCISGVFTALGTTIGFTLFLIVFASLLSGLKQLPFIEDILRETKIDALIEAQLNNLSNVSSTVTDNNIDDNKDNPTKSNLGFIDETLGISFEYPSYLNDINRRNNYVNLSGSGVLSSFEIFIDDSNFSLVGTSVAQTLVDANDNEFEMLVFEDGAKVNGIEYKSPLFYLQYNNEDHVFHILGHGQKSSPKLAREQFILIVESIRMGR